MKHRAMAVVAGVMMFALPVRAASYGWSFWGGETNNWTYADNWTNLMDGSTGVPGDGDTAIFPRRENAPNMMTVALDTHVTVDTVLFGHNFGGFFLTGTYTLAIAASPPKLWGDNYYGGHTTLDCDVDFLNITSTLRLVNWNQVLTLNGTVRLPATAVGFQIQCWGDNEAAVIINGQLTGYAPGQDWRMFYFPQLGDEGGVTMVSQHNPLRKLGVKQGTLYLAGNYDAPHGDDNIIRFPPYDNPSPKKIRLVAENGTAVFSNRWVFSIRKTPAVYQEFGVAEPTINAVCVRGMEINDLLRWRVDQGCYRRLEHGIRNGDVLTNDPRVAVIMWGGGTTDIAAAQLDDVVAPGSYTPIAFVVSNGVLRANNGAEGLVTHGAVTVLPQGVVGGHGGVGALITHSGARVAPGNSIGTRFVSNDCTLAAGTIFDWDVQGGSADLLNVGGTLDLSAGTITVRAHGFCDETDTNVIMRGYTRGLTCERGA